jgi:hypothetical protein
MVRLRTTSTGIKGDDIPDGSIVKARLWHGVARRARAIPWQAIDYISQIPFVSAVRQRRYDLAVQRHEPVLPALADSWHAIGIGLRERGIAQSSLKALDLPCADEVMASASALIDEWRPKLRTQAKAGIDFLMVPAAEITRRPEIFRFGLHPELLRLAEAHIGLPVAYDGVTVQYTVADGRQVSTRDWHRDREDRRMIKLAIYLNDVDEAGGPFQLLPGERPGRAFYLSEKSDAELRAAPPISCEGAAGTVVFADTARYFHRGKPATSRDRAALFFSYFAKKPQRPYFCERSGLTRRQIAALTEGLTPEQHDAALWQRALPLRWRIIPPAAL